MELVCFHFLTPSLSHPAAFWDLFNLFEIWVVVYISKWANWVEKVSEVRSLALFYYHTRSAAALRLTKIFLISPFFISLFTFTVFWASWTLHSFPLEHLLESVKRRLQSEDTRRTCIWIQSGKNPINFHNRKVSGSNKCTLGEHAFYLRQPPTFSFFDALA